MIIIIKYLFTEVLIKHALNKVKKKLSVWVVKQLA